MSSASPPVVILTRARGDNSSLAAIVRRSGGRPVEAPLIELRATGAALPRPRPGDLVVFTSRRAVEAGWAAWSPAALDGALVAAVGPATAAALTAGGRSPDGVPRRALGRGLLAALDARGEALVGRRVIYPRAAAVQGDLEEGLRARGAAVEGVIVYRNVCPQGAREAVVAALPAAVIALASGSAGRHLAALGLDLGAAAVAAIGPSTADASRPARLRVDAVADPHTQAGLGAAIKALLAAR
jgi:uroporphyrinogen III methyltransferase/synthase